MGPFLFQDENKTFCVNDNARVRTVRHGYVPWSLRSHSESETEVMAGNLPVTNGVELKLVWTVGGVPAALNILHATNSTGTAMTQTRADSISTVIKSAFTSSLLPAQLHTSTGLLRVEVRSMSANSDPWFIGAGAAVPGTATGKPLPAATALVCTLKTGLRGRSYNGRFYQFGWAETANDTAGGATDAAANSLGGFLNTIRTNLTGAPSSLALAILSRFTTPPGTSTAIERNPPVLTPITQEVILDHRWDTQRRRAIPGI